MNAALEIFASRFSPPGWNSAEAGEVCIPSMTGASDAFLSLALAERCGIVLAVTPGLPAADRLSDDLFLLSGGKTPVSSARILEFPPPLDGDKSTLGVRLKTAAALKARPIKPYPCIVVAAFSAISAALPAGDLALRLKPGTPAPEGGMSGLAQRLSEFGYERMPQVEKEGDFSVRGGVFDVWSPGEEFPVRAEFFGDDLESLRAFNPATQTSIGRIDGCEILPATGAAGAGGRVTLRDLLPADTVVLALEHNDYSLKPWTGKTVYTGDPAPRGVVSYDFPTSPLPGFAELGADETHHPELFEAARKRLDQHLAAAGNRGDTVLHIDELSGGFGVEGLVVVSKADRVFSRRPRRPRTGAATGGQRLSDFDDLEAGEYVVHVDYGVGRYIGSSEIFVDGRRSEVFTIEYADGGKLHVPAAQAHLLSRYVGVKGEAVRLHRLDGTRWAKDRLNAQKAVSDLAASLLETQAKRETTPGFAYDVDCDGADAFAAAFPFEETADQTAAIEAVRADMASRKPMDRLICGDAGYGKTEVAMRAAFIAAMNGRQVAVLAPTTVLAEQHFETFTSRFDGTPIRIESCSRFQTADTRAGTFRRIANGVCDIVIGTHAILSPKVRFRDLGLIVIDEEQRFGVRHKEYLKRLRATADVLTLSATPIPRTLYLSMTGARDLSLLRSPPSERVAVETRIVRDADETVRDAIDAEIARGGLVYFLHNRVMDIGRVEKRLRALCPGARVAVAHGRMEPQVLARKMRDFERGEYDVLLSTTIVESGIDIPRANTILIDRADTFGLADLYQLRGRVGRSSRQGYAYFLLPPSGAVDSDARERLAAIKRHGGLGGGFNLAVRDLELRGAGNLLGSQQSGHIAAVGFGLYCQLLKRTIAMMKGEKVKEVVDVKLNLDFINPRIPYDYIEEDVLRLTFLKRFAEAQDARTVKALAAEMADRFGPLPREAVDFVSVAGLRVACARASVGNLDVKGTRAVFYRAGSREVFKVVELKSGSPQRKIAELARAVVRTTRSPAP
ncbi:MAG: transcription-repair coupling factor [Kiritimatiellae bacterium]|nr:transcription-repair coupling factor [Kiritimatiellia bacterium]